MLSIKPADYKQDVTAKRQQSKPCQISLEHVHGHDGGIRENFQAVEMSTQNPRMNEKFMKTIKLWDNRHPQSKNGHQTHKKNSRWMGQKESRKSLGSHVI